MAIEKVSPAMWNELSDSERNSLIERQIWKDEIFKAWLKEKEEEDAMKRPTMYKKYQRYLKKNSNN
jgi:hypothetical protein